MKDTLSPPNLSSVSTGIDRRCPRCVTRIGAYIDPPIGAGSVFSIRQRLLLLVGFAVLLVLRLPEAWLHGRFLGEEGTVFMAYAWHRPVGAALWRSFAGYLNLAANASTLATVELVRGGMLSLELAPYFTMTLGTLFQLVPAILIITGNGQWLANRLAVIACLLIIAMSPMTEEVFANVLHIQFHLALSVGLILALDIPVEAWRRFIYGVPLVLAPLCGPGAIVILPFFALRSIIDKDKARLIQTAALAAGSAVQLLLFYHKEPLRGHMLSPDLLANVLFLRLAVMPFLSMPISMLAGYLDYHNYLNGGIRWWCTTALSLMYFVWLVGTALRGTKDSAFWLIMVGLALAIISFGGGALLIDNSQWFAPTSAERYNFLPLAFLGIGLVALVMRHDKRYRRICLTLCVLTALSGAATFAIPTGILRSGPDWRTEVAAWRKNHDHMLASWPRQWVIDLSDHDLPCSKPSVVGKMPNDPGYCESAWLARVVKDSKKRAWIISR